MKETKMTISKKRKQYYSWDARILHINITRILTIWYLPEILHDSNTCYEYLTIARLLQGY